MQRRADSTGLEFIDIGGELPAPGLSAHASDVATRPKAMSQRASVRPTRMPTTGIIAMTAKPPGEITSPASVAV